jgi:hypothetical protein
MEGSWTFAGCVISDSTSSTPSHALHTEQFYTKRGQDLPVPDMQAGFSSHKPDLSPDQAPRGSRAGFCPSRGHRSVADEPNQAAAISDAARIALLPPGTVRQGRK